MFLLLPIIFFKDSGYLFGFTAQYRGFEYSGSSEGMYFSKGKALYIGLHPDKIITNSKTIFLIFFFLNLKNSIDKPCLFYNNLNALKIIYFYISVFCFINFSCDRSKKNNNYEIIIEKKKIDSINFKAKIIIRDKSNLNAKNETYILIDNEIELKSKVNSLKEKFLQNKDVSN